MKLEKLEDLLTLDVDKLKSPEKTRLITKIKQLIKSENKAENLAESLAEELPYEAVSVVGGELVLIRFDLVSKKARVVDTVHDSRDVKGRNYMAGSAAILKIKKLVKEQKEIINE